MDGMLKKILEKIAEVEKEQRLFDKTMSDGLDRIERKLLSIASQEKKNGGLRVIRGGKEG